MEFEIYAPGTDKDLHAYYFAYVRRNSDGLYWDQADETFKDFTALLNGRILFVEDANQPGVWSADVDLGLTTGTLTMLPRDGQTGFLVEGGVEEVYALDGERLDAFRGNRIGFYEHYSGYNALQLLDDVGEPVEGALIVVYTKTDYDQGNFGQVIGESCTNSRGYWIHPIFVSVGAAYTIVYSKEYEIDTTVHEVVVP